MKNILLNGTQIQCLKGLNLKDAISSLIHLHYQLVVQQIDPQSYLSETCFTGK